ncbi:MAG: PepSY-associated TM helix domain-containing protein, partial [Pseudomonadota bacterium]
LARETEVSIPPAAAPFVEFDEMIINLDGPGVDATLTIDLVTGEAFYERIDNGFIAKLNDLHKGRDTGIAWGILIDLTALAGLIFCISGLGLLVINAKARATTWPLTTLGVVVPVIAYILFVHS